MTTIGFAPTAAVGQRLTFPDGETPVTGVRFPMGSVARLVLATGEHAERTNDGHQDTNFVLVDEATPYRDYFYKDNPELEQRSRFVGAEVNPTPENGATYRCFSRDRHGALSRSFLLRYNDDDHRGDRNNSTYAWSVIGGADGPHYLDTDALTETPALYVKVESVGIPTEGAPAVSSPTELDELLSPVSAADLVDPAPAVAEPEPAPVDPNIARFFGKGKLEEDGTLALNPEVEVGEWYIIICPSYSRLPYIGIATAGGGRQTDSFSTIGIYADADSPMREDFQVFDRRYWEMEWVKADAKDSRPESAVEDGVRENLEAQLLVERTEYTRLRTDLNEVAREQGWCSDYDAIVQMVGMPGRNQDDPDAIEDEDSEPTNYDWTVSITAEVSFTDSSPNSRIDDAMAEDYEVSRFVTGSISGTATVEFEMTVDEEPNEESVRDYVDSSEVSNWMNNNLDISIDEVSSFRITSIEQGDES